MRQLGPLRFARRAAGVKNDGRVFSRCLRKVGRAGGGDHFLKRFGPFEPGPRDQSRPYKPVGTPARASASHATAAHFRSTTKARASLSSS